MQVSGVPAAPAAGGRLTLLICCSALFMVTLDNTILNVALPSLQHELSAAVSGLQWTVDGYILVRGALLFATGSLGDRYGRRRLFRLGLVAFTVSSLACSLAPSLDALVGFRCAQAVGGALMTPSTLAIITNTFTDPRRRAQAIGLWSGSTGLSTAAGPVLGGLLVEYVGWRSVFWVNVPIGVVTLVLAARWVPESRAARTRRLDLAGVAVLSVALVLLVLPLIQGRQAGWPWWSWACLAGSAVAFGCFTAVERAVARRGGDPLVALALFGQRSFAVGLVLVVCVYSVLSSYYLALSVSVQDGLGLSAVGAGLVYAPAAVTFFVFGLVAGRLVPRYGRRVLEVGAVVLALGYLSTALVLAFGPALSPVVVIPTLVVQSAGGGLLITPLLNVVLSRVAPEVVGAASGALSTAQQVGAALGVALVGAVFFGAFDPGRGGAVRAAGHAFALASVTVCAIAAVVAALVFLLPRGSTADRR
jgi:EmrB/QacA subfamily drug resistance transporter